jgi:hypothetical protein
MGSTRLGQRGTHYVLRAQTSVELQDFRFSASEAYEMIKSVVQPVNVILDLSWSNKMPDGFSSAIRDVNRDMPQNTGRIFLVQRSSFVEIMVNAMSRLVRGQRRPFTMVHTLSEARRLAAVPCEPGKSPTEKPALNEETRR